MIRKTFNTKPEALKYKEEIIAQEGIAVVGALGDKFRVYLHTKETFEKTKCFRGETYTKGDAERFLRHNAWAASDAIANALALQKSMVSGDIYSDYETSIEAARIMQNIGELKSAKDVLDFVDDTEKYNKIMEQFIKETFEEYDYEAVKEVCKE